MRNVILLAGIIFSVEVNAAPNACSLFPDIQGKYGDAVTVQVELGIVENTWMAESVCTKRFLRRPNGSLGGFFLAPWIAYLDLDLRADIDPRIKRDLSHAAKALQKTKRHGGFLYITADVSGIVRTSDTNEDRGRIEVTDIRNLKTSEQPPPEKLPVVSLCAIFKDLSAYDRKRVAIRAEIANTIEGAWLVPVERCSQRFVTKGFAWGFDLALSGTRTMDLPKPGLTGPPRWERQSISGIFVGTIILPDEYVVICRFNKLSAFGFGHLGGSAGAFLGETVLMPVSSGEPFRGNSGVEPQECTTDSDQK